MSAAASSPKILHQQAQQLEQDFRLAATDLREQLQLVDLLVRFGPGAETARALAAAKEALTIFAAGYADSWALLNEALDSDT